MTHRHTIPATIAASVLVLLVGCSGDDDASPTDTTSTTAAPSESVAPPGSDATPDDAPATGPASIRATDQSGDGTSVVVDSVTLPTDGFVVVHADADGGPGPILGWSDLLPAGESTDVVVQLTDPITATATVHPMAHVDANANGEYEFLPPDVTIDVPATTADGDIAMLPITYTVDDGEADAAGTSLQLVSTQYGDVLADGDGWILYLFTPDDRGDSTCYDGCAANWPPVPEIAEVGDGLDPTLLGTTARTDGTTQATYGGWPLYLFAGDAEPGDTNGQGVNDVWFVIDANGDATG